MTEEQRHKATVSEGLAQRPQTVTTQEATGTHALRATKQAPEPIGWITLYYGLQFKK